MKPVVIVAGGLIAALIALFSGKKKSDGGGGTDDGTDPNFNKIDPTKPKKKGGADVFGDLKNLPANFDPLSNQVLVSSDCSVVLVGAGFWPSSFGISAIEAETLYETLAISGNSVVGFVDYLMEQEGLEQPEEIAARIMVEISPLCWDIPVSQWSPAYQGFFNWLMDRLVPYVEAYVIGDFDPNG